MTKDEALKTALELAKIRWDGPASQRSYADKMVIDACEKALAQDELCSSQEPVAWKPIKTAPKDVMVLVCLPRQMNLVVRAWYNSIHNFWQTDYEGEGGITRPIYFHEGDLWHPIPPLYTTPPKRPWGKPWVSLTDEEISQLWISTSPYFNEDDFARAIEAKLKQKNGFA